MLLGISKFNSRTMICKVQLNLFVLFPIKMYLVFFRAIDSSKGNSGVYPKDCGMHYLI